MQDLDERRIQKLAQGYVLFSDTEKHVMPIIGKCLEGITKAGTNVNEKNVSGSRKKKKKEKRTDINVKHGFVQLIRFSLKSA